MATVMAQPNGVPPTPPNPNAEPTDEWKEALRKEVEQSLSPMFMEAKEALDSKLSVAPVDPESRDKLAKEHSDTMKNIRRIAEDLFQDQVEAERQQLRWAQGGTMSHEWSGGILRHQKAILEQIEREKRAGSRANSSQIPGVNQSRQHQQSQSPPGESPTYEREGEYISRDPNRNHVPLSPGHATQDRVTGRPRNSSAASNGYEQRYAGERTGDYTRSAIVDEPEEMDRSFRPSYPEGKGSIRRQNTSTGPKGIPEIWKPSISPEQDAALSRPSALPRRGSISSIQSNSYRSPSTTHISDRPEPTLARQGSTSSIGPQSYRSPGTTHFPDRPEQRPVPRQGSVSSIGSYSYRPPSTSQIPEYPEPVDIAALEERERSSIQAVDEQWSGIDRAREQARSGQDTRYRSGSAQRTEEYTGMPSPNSAGPSPVSNHSPAMPGHSPTGVYATGPRPVDHRHHPSSLTASRPIPNERSFTMDESTRTPQSSSPLSQGWAGGSARPPMNNRSEPGVSRSPPILGDYLRTQQPVHIRPRVSTQNLQGDHRSHMMSRSTSNSSQTPESDDDDWEESQDEEVEAASRRERWRKEEEIKRMEEEARRIEEEALRQQADARRKAEEAERLEREAKAKDEAARLKEEETRKKEAEVKRREEEVRRREEELERREAESRRKEEEKRRKQQEEQQKRDLEARRIETEKREAIVRQREEELERREAEARRKEEEEQREEREAIRKVEEMVRREEENARKEKIQQDEFRKREEEIRRRAQERKYQEWQGDSAKWTSAKPSTSPPSTGPWPIPNRSGSTGTSSQADRNSSTSGSSWTSPSSRPGFNPSTPVSSTRTSTPSIPSKPTSNTPRPTGFTGAGVKPGTSPHPSASTSEAEWARRQEEQARKQQEAFRREQEQQELKRQTQASKILSKEDVLQLFAVHERQWAALPNLEELQWHSFPWPVWKPPKDPEDLTSIHVGAYVLSQYHPSEKSKSSKDRIKEHIRRWHPDRFETKYLPKVKQEDREKVKEGAGVVARVLNEMLTRSNVHDVFS
jgi:hypothetical protein